MKYNLIPYYMSLLKAVCSNFYLLHLTLLFYGNSVVVLVVCRSTERTHTCLIISTEPIQRSLMFLTYIVLQITHRIHQFVFLQTCHSQMTLQMSFTVRALTHQTRLQGFQLSFLTDVTQNFSCFLRTFLFIVIYELEIWWWHCWKERLFIISVNSFNTVYKESHDAPHEAGWMLWVFRDKEWRLLRNSNIKRSNAVSWSLL